LDRNPRVRLRQVDARRVADDRLFDLILAVDALHDMAAPAGVLNSARNALAKAGVIAIAELPYPPEFSGQADAAERLGYRTSLFNCLHHQIKHSGAGLVGRARKRHQSLGYLQRLPSCTAYDNDARLRACSSSGRPEQTKIASRSRYPPSLRSIAHPDWHVRAAGTCQCM
jgi:hypothetical protein